MKRLGLLLTLVAIVGLALVAPGGSASARVHRASAFARQSRARTQLLRKLIEQPHGKSFCQVSRVCKDTYNVKTSGYVGHDEPSVGFYDDTPGSGFDMTYQITLPRDASTTPTQDGTGGTWNFQLRPTFWLGLTLCDSQSAPEYTDICVPDSDANAMNSKNPKSKNYLGRHPGNAYMELQFYSPGYVSQFNGFSCTATQYCAAMTIDSVSYDQNDPKNRQNNDCLKKNFLIGIEPVNWAYVTTDGVSQAPANPLFLSNDPTLSGLNPDPTQDLMMNPGDRLKVHMYDTSAGFRVAIDDLTSGGTGSMTASIANGFGQVMFQPQAKHCHVRPYAFHPEYASAVTRGNTWSLHTNNVAFSDEIGHFEYCNAINKEGGNCTDPGVPDTAVDKDDSYCFTGASSTLVDITSCFNSDSDFDGPSYQNVWPGTTSSPALQSDPVRFTSPVFGSGLTNYQRVAFETDLPGIESVKNCNPDTGVGCVNPPSNAQFYPFFSSGPSVSGCDWMEGGASIPGATNTYGGSSTAEFGSLLKVWFPSGGWKSEGAYTVFNQTLDTNPCMQT